MSQMYDFGQLYGQADMTAGVLIDAGSYDAVVETAEYGMTNDGSKGQWTVRFRITTGPHAGVPMTTNMTISPVKNVPGPGIRWASSRGSVQPSSPIVGL